MWKHKNGKGKIAQMWKQNNVKTVKEQKCENGPNSIMWKWSKCRNVKKGQNAKKLKMVKTQKHENDLSAKMWKPSKHKNVKTVKTQKKKLVKPQER